MGETLTTKPVKLDRQPDDATAFAHNSKNAENCGAIIPTATEWEQGRSGVSLHCWLVEGHTGKHLILANEPCPECAGIDECTPECVTYTRKESGEIPWGTDHWWTWEGPAPEPELPQVVSCPRCAGTGKVRS